MKKTVFFGFCLAFLLIITFPVFSQVVLGQHNTGRRNDHTIRSPTNVSLVTFNVLVEQGFYVRWTAPYANMSYLVKIYKHPKSPDYKFVEIFSRETSAGATEIRFVTTFERGATYSAYVWTLGDNNQRWYAGRISNSGNSRDVTPWP